MESDCILYQQITSSIYLPDAKQGKSAGKENSALGEHLEDSIKEKTA